jgi:hypothetical protein
MKDSYGGKKASGYVFVDGSCGTVAIPCLFCTSALEDRLSAIHWFFRHNAGRHGSVIESIGEALGNRSRDPKEVEKFADAFFNRSESKDSMAGAAFIVVKGNKVIEKWLRLAEVEKKLPHF